MKKYFLIITILLLFTVKLFAREIDLNKKPMYVRKGFSLSWINAMPKGTSWRIIPPSEDGNRRIRFVNLGRPNDILGDNYFKNLPSSSFFSLKQNKPITFTMMTFFNLTKKEIKSQELLGLYLEQIGLNWQIYINGHLLKSEMHISSDGWITKERNIRFLLIPLNPRLLKQGRNILTFRLIGDPTHVDSGFYKTGPYKIGNFEKLHAGKYESLSLVLSVIYLIVGLYHLFLFLFRRYERYNLYYSLFSICYFIFIFTRTYSAYSFIENTQILFIVELSSLFLVFPLILSFFDYIFLNRLKLYTKIYSIFCILFVMLIIPTPGPFKNNILRVWQASALISIVYIFFWFNKFLSKNI
jgi:hypothetical protein